MRFYQPQVQFLRPLRDGERARHNWSCRNSNMQASTIKIIQLVRKNQLTSSKYEETRSRFIAKSLSYAAMLLLRGLRFCFPVRAL
jgi:hypothetical protein